MQLDPDPTDTMQSTLDELHAGIATLDQAEIDARNLLDHIIGRRSILQAAATDLHTHLEALNAFQAPTQPDVPAEAAAAPPEPVAAASDPPPPPAAKPAKKPAPKKGTAKIKDPVEKRPYVRRGEDYWREVFAWVSEHKAAGTYSLAGLIDTFGSSATSWRAQCARYGLELDSPAAQPRRPGHTHTPQLTSVEEAARMIEQSR